MTSEEERKAKRREYQARFRANHPDYAKQKYEANKEAERAKARARYWADPEAHRAAMRQRDPEEKNAAGRESRARLRTEGFDHYGKVCDCCGEANRKFLTFDHPENNGAQHKVELAGSYFNASSSTVLRELRKLGWPAGVLVVLCWNCNSGRQYNGGVCPHKE